MRAPESSLIAVMPAVPKFWDFWSNNLHGLLNNNNSSHIRNWCSLCCVFVTIWQNPPILTFAGRCFVFIIRQNLFFCREVFTGLWVAGRILAPCKTPRRTSHHKGRLLLDVGDDDGFVKLDNHFGLRPARQILDLQEGVQTGPQEISTNVALAKGCLLCGIQCATVQECASLRYWHWQSLHSCLQLATSAIPSQIMASATPINTINTQHQSINQVNTFCERAFLPDSEYMQRPESTKWSMINIPRSVALTLASLGNVRCMVLI